MLILICGCSRSVWDVPVEDFRERMGLGEHAFLRHIRYSDFDANEARRLGPHGPFYLSAAYRALGLIEMEKRMLAISRVQDEGPWREEANLRWFEMLLDAKAHAEIAGTVDEVLADVAEPRIIDRLEQIHTEALYRLGRDEEVLARVVEGGEGRPNPTDPTDEAAAERALYAAVASSRLGAASWPGMVRGLFLDYDASTIHARAWGFLAADTGRRGAFDEEELRYFEAKSRLSTGESGAALGTLTALLPDRRLRGQGVYRDLGFVYLAEGRYAAGAAAMTVLLETDPDSLDIPEMAGRLSRKAGLFAQGEALLVTVVRQTELTSQRRRALWFSLDCALGISPRRALGLLEAHQDCLDVAAYFDDVLDELVTGLLASTDWSGLERLRALLSSLEAREDYAVHWARVSYLLARATALGLADTGHTRQALLRECVETDPKGYHGLLASTMLGLAWRTEGTAVAPAVSWDDEEYVMGFLDYGLPVEAYQVIVIGEAAVGEGVLVQTARLLQALGYHLKSIRVAGEIERAGGVLRGAGLLLAYPSLYISEIEILSGRTGVPESLAQALIREESRFETRIVSAAGAVGLTQLMAATAGDVARKLGMDEVDLRDPATNLTLGLTHLGDLLSRLDSFPRALMAYNAGLSRVRRWETQFAHFADDLMAEAIPFRETRGYVRKILVSQAIYGDLYRGKPPTRTVADFYPHLGIAEAP